MAMDISIYNSSANGFEISVNHGPRIKVPGTTAGLKWAPQSQEPGKGPSWSMQWPEPNVLSYGQNLIELFVEGSPKTLTLPLRLPSHQRINSIQMYFLIANNEHVNWTMLNDGNLLDYGAIQKYESA
jgi:hypothetical protein